MVNFLSQLRDWRKQLFQAKITPAAEHLDGIQVHRIALIPPSTEVHPCAQSQRAQSVRAVLRQRKRRSNFFAAKLFSDPAWDMLLTLYAAHLGQTRLSIGSLCRTGGVAGTTGLRWIALFEKEGLAARRNDPLDGRRVYIEITTKGLAAMNGCFEGVCLTSETVQLF